VQLRRHLEKHKINDKTNNTKNVNNNNEITYAQNTDKKFTHPHTY